MSPLWQVAATVALVVSPVATDHRGMMPGTVLRVTDGDETYLVADPTHLPPCETEDSDNCYWNAASRGNGDGRSFYVLDGVVTYLD